MAWRTSILQGIAESVSLSPSARRLKVAFDREYRTHGVNPPAAPPGWSGYSLHEVHNAGWPDGWEKRWMPNVICEICGDLVKDEYQRALMEGHFGVEWYPVHPDCGEEMAKQMD